MRGLNAIEAIRLLKDQTLGGGKEDPWRIVHCTENTRSDHWFNVFMSHAIPLMNVSQAFK